MLFQGASIVLPDTTTTGGQARIFGYLNHPDRNLVDIATPWNQLQSELGENVQIIEDVLAMVELARSARHYGPFMLYVPKNYERKLEEDYRGPNSSDSRTVYERLNAIREISDVKVPDFLPDHSVVLVSLNRNVVDWAEAQDITTVQWTVTGGMVQEYKVMMVGVPRIKSDYDGRCGIVHAYPIT